MKLPPSSFSHLHADAVRQPPVELYGWLRAPHHFTQEVEQKEAVQILRTAEQSNISKSLYLEPFIKCSDLQKYTLGKYNENERHINIKHKIYILERQNVLLNGYLAHRAVTTSSTERLLAQRYASVTRSI